jgi:aspartate racemase
MADIERIIGIGGGVGPMAGVGLHEKIILNTIASTDQGHPTVVHVSDSVHIPDRTKYLLGEIEDDPAEGMLKVMQMIEAAAKIAGRDAVAGIPCNTFHAPQIWEHFMQLLKDNGVELQMVHMLRETADYIKQAAPQARKLGLMSTTGTREVGVYQQILEPLGYDILEVPAEMQPALHDSIYNPVWGIKAQTPVSDKARGNFLSYAGMLQDQGAEVIILGCTEIPLALPETNLNGTPLINPVVALARGLIREAAPDKLKPLTNLGNG